MMHYFVSDFRLTVMLLYDIGSSGLSAGYRQSTCRVTQLAHCGLRSSPNNTYYKLKDLCFHALKTRGGAVVRIQGLSTYTFFAVDDTPSTQSERVFSSLQYAA